MYYKTKQNHKKQKYFILKQVQNKAEHLLQDTIHSTSSYTDDADHTNQLNYSWNLLTQKHISITLSTPLMKDFNFILL